jgi:hypothetical protein
MTYDDPQERNAYMREYRARKGSGSFEQRRRGRKPISLGLLCTWEFEWYKAFHLLRDGTQLPPDPNFVAANESATREELQWWKEASLKEILGDMQPNTPPPFDELPEGDREKAIRCWVMREWNWYKEFAEQQRKAEIAALERWLKPRETPTRTERRKNWATLADPEASIKAIEHTCEEWKRLPDVRRQGMTVFADHVLANMEEFRQMKRDQRYPSLDADESRMEHIARGMAGVMVGASPITAIQRLRLMKHEPGGPLWVEKESWVDTKGKSNEVPPHCRCWRCTLKRSRRTWSRLRTLQEKEPFSEAKLASQVVEQAPVIQTEPEESPAPIRAIFCCPSCGAHIPKEAPSGTKSEWTIVCQQCALHHQQDPVRHRFDGTFHAAIVLGQKGDSL